MIYDYLFYYLFKLFKLFKSDDGYFNAVLVLSIVAFTNIMLLLLFIKAFDLIFVPIVGIIETVILVTLPFSVLYFIYGYKEKYKIRIKEVESASKKTENNVRHYLINLRDSILLITLYIW